ncbi:hypothetical protein ACQ4LE_010459 [Meloidogyne hapla]
MNLECFLNMLPISNIDAIDFFNERLDDKKDKMAAKLQLSTKATEINKIQMRVHLNEVTTSISKNKRFKKQFRRNKDKDRQIFPQKHQEHLSLLQKVHERYVTRKEKDELKEAVFDIVTKRPMHPASYQRMMQRVMDSNINRLIQPEPPVNLLPSNLLCALCFQQSGEQGELFGPYFVSLSAECQPPERIIPRALFSQKRKQNNGSPTRSHQLSGSLDVWIHGECALWAPDLFLVGGRFPNFQKNILSYWKQKCTICGDIGATIPLYMDSERTSDDKISPSSHVKGQNVVHYRCAVTSGYILDRHSLRCIRDALNT